MSITLYVLDTPEFEAVGTVAHRAGMTSSAAGDYVEWTTSMREVVLRRSGADLRDALWFAALTGGCDAVIGSYDDSAIALRATDDQLSEPAGAWVTS